MLQQQRNRTAAWMVAAAALAACAPPQGVRPPGDGGVGAPPTAQPTSPVAPSPSQRVDTPSSPAGATPAPGFSASPSASSRAFGILRGTVYDGKAGAVPDGTQVTITSLDASRPFSATVETTQGAYVVNQVPLDTQVRVVASRKGWTQRSQVTVVRPRDPRREVPNVLDFGGKGGSTDARVGLPYFLSPHPEIVSVSPADQDSSVAMAGMRFSLTLSEKLDAENQRRLASAFMIVPNNLEAVANGTAIGPESSADEEVDGLRVASAALPERVLPYAYRQNAAFLAGVVTSTFTWDAEGKTATFEIKAPVKTGRTEEAEYAFMLVQRGSLPIRDAEGKALGTDDEGKFGAARDGELIFNAVTEPSITVTEAADEEEERWTQSHLTFTRFRVERDDVRPRLVSVQARRNFASETGADVDRIELTFSEPMMAYPRITTAGLLSLNNYVFATGASEAALKDVQIEAGEAARTVSPNRTGKELRTDLTAGSVRINSPRALDGEFRVLMGVQDPRVVVLELPAGAFPDEADYVKVHAGTDQGTDGSAEVVSDPAGNPISLDHDTVSGPVL